MQILIAEDEPTSRLVLETTLRKWGHDVISTSNGAQAWEMLQGADPPQLAMLDWMMPELDGVRVCQKVRSTPSAQSVYIILLSARGSKEHIITGLERGANDYVTKPFDREELRARLQVGVRTVELQNALADRVRELQEALSHIRLLQGILPICSYCKKVRGDQDYWEQVESYISTHSDVQFSHSVCPACYEGIVQPELEQARRQKVR